ncbi:acetylxylan esterase [Paenibacillus baekrokdamisoli]|uniref:Acetylxylan esterase n=1 Tax=Paenibacillus baekrokdamisoli TaxID=1712516 RepID=A0A3G9J5Z0_9BACL|nr:acetylxylan esterase [Paenibacillus baekrokdamisoli]MBB3067656.1 cephalosporin-C deacetylase [Paenibacillus baekrokdamisoli]BBH19158.1 acetylxylan esterase [Paenibacillus baekrokdamisoli]
MPTIDMTLDELRQYKGTNPCPVDLDSFWDESIQEMKSVHANVELVPSKFQVPSADCFDLYFTGVGGARIHAKYLRPKHASEPHPAVVNFHGYSLDSGDWIDKLSYVSLGYSVLAMDCRGQGGKSEDSGSIKGGNTYFGHIIRGLDMGPKHLLFRQIFLDTAQLAGIAMELPEVDGTRVGAFGESQGGGLVLACAALEPRIKLAAPVFPFLSDYKRVWDMDLDVSAYQELRNYFRQFDPLHEREDEIFENLGYIDIQFLAKRIRGKVMMAVGLMDTVCPPSTQFAAYNKINAEKQVVIYPDFAHERLPGINDRTLEFMCGL